LKNPLDHGALRADRRGFLLGSLAGLSVLARSTFGAGLRPAPARTLVLVQLTGGNDGLSTLVPYAEDGYARARESLLFTAEQVLRLDARVGLHPGLARLHRRYGAGHVALFEGVGYPQPNRSHFRSLDIWHAADARGRALGTGWVGRILEALPEPPVTAVIHVGQRPPFALQSSARPPVSITPERLELAPGDAGLGEAEEPAAGSTLDYVRRAAHDSRAATGVIRAALERDTTARPAYPNSDFARDLTIAAKLVHAEIGLRVCSLELDGFDTHREQRGPHGDLMRVLDGGLNAFLDDLEQSQAGRETIVLVFSEFGRRVAENGSAGTDHGAAGLALALGARVRGGLYGRPPALDRLEDGDLAFTTDFRSLYARAIEHVFELEPARILGEPYTTQAWV